jgi:hypothetical protein
VPLGIKEVGAPRISRQSKHEGGNVSPTPRPPLHPGTQFCQRLSRTQDHSAAGRIMSKKISNDPIGNRTRVSPIRLCFHKSTKRVLRRISIATCFGCNDSHRGAAQKNMATADRTTECC